MQNLRIVWLSILASQLVFPVVLWAAADPAAVADDVVTIALLVVGLAQGGLSLAWGRVLKVGDPSSWPFLRWALAESVTLMGFALGFMGGPLLVVGCLMAIGFTLVAVQPPREA